MKDFTKDVANRELIQMLRDAGYAELVDALSCQEAYTKSGRINRTALCRMLGWSQTRVKLALEACVELLEGLK